MASRRRGTRWTGPRSVPAAAAGAAAPFGLVMAAAGAAALFVLGVPSAGAAQQAVDRVPRATARLSADTVLVGEPFIVGIVALTSEPLRFPPILRVSDPWEQLAGVRLENPRPGEVRAYYRLVAWESGRHPLPDLVVSTRTGNGRRDLHLALPAPFVRSVLPADAEDLKLMPPRPPLGPGFPWMLLIALLALLALAAAAAWWWRRRRRAAREAPLAEAPEPNAAERTRAAILALRAEAEAGRLGAAAFYDRLEEIFRDYLGATQAWPPTRPIRGARAMGFGAMRDLHRHAVVSRFAAVDLPGRRMLSDADSSLAWLDKDAA